MDALSLYPLTLSLDEGSGKLHARFTPTSGMSPPDAAVLRQALNERGWANCYLDAKAIDGFIANCGNPQLPAEAIIGERRDGEFSLAVDSDLMTAWLTLVPPQGGHAVTREAIEEAVRREGIVHGIAHRKIDAAFTVGHCERVAIAHGDLPEEGTPTRFETLFDKVEQPTEDKALERIKYADLCHLLLIQPGDKLMRRVPPIPGKDGCNIKGQPILLQPMPDVPFRWDLQGAAPDQGNPNLLVATTGGQPTALDDGVTVNPMIEVPEVGLKSGSIEFEGTLHVGGDIKAGMHVKVTGDVIVNGAVEAAHIHAGGNVAVRGGIVGHPDTRPGSHALPETTARIFCGGSLQALFMENVHVEAGKSILIGRSTLQCELIAGEEVVVGEPSVRTGQIIGGRTQATMQVATGTLGSPTGIKTYVQVGLDPYLEKQIADKELEFTRKCDEVDRVVKLLAYFKQNPKKGEGGVAEKVAATQRQLLANIDALTAELKALRGKMDVAEQSRVEASREIFYGTEIRIAQQFWQAPDDMQGATIELQGDHIEVSR